VVDHIQHAANVGGIEHVGFGSDGPLQPERDLAKYLDGMAAYVERTRGIPGSERVPKHVVVPELDSVERMQRLAWALSRRKFSDDAIDKIIGGNFLRVFSEACDG
jgi:membrane dipeptidase